MLLEAKDIRVSFRKENQTRLFGRERQEVLHGLSIDLKEGECLGIIGESGSGKSTFGRVLCGLLAPDSGTVRLDGLDLYGRLPRVDKARIQSSISIVFQDYTTSANPRFRVQGIIGESFCALRLNLWTTHPLSSGLPLFLIPELRAVSGNLRQPEVKCFAYK